MTDIVYKESDFDADTSCLDLSYSSSEFEDDNNSKYDDRLDGGIQSYFMNQWKIQYQIAAMIMTDLKKRISRGFQIWASKLLCTLYYFYKTMIGVHVETAR